MTTATATAVVSSSVFLGRDSGYTPHLRPDQPPGGAARGDLTPLTLLDILPDRTATAVEPLDNWRVLGEINTGIIKRLTIQQGSTE